MQHVKNIEENKRITKDGVILFYPKYKPEFCDMLVEHMKGGLSFESFAGLVGTCRNTLYTWENDYPEFKKAKEAGRAACLLYDERILREGVEGNIKGYNVAAHKWKMANIHKWADRQEVDHTSTDGSAAPNRIEIVSSLKSE
jgi:hypothetical protein